MPGTNRRIPVSEIEASAVALATQLEEVLWTMTNEIIGGGESILTLEYEAMAYKGREISRHYEELARLRTKARQV